MRPSAGGLQPVLKFTDKDLQANRRGELTAEQVKRMRRDQGRTALLAALVFVALVLAATVLIFAGQTQNNSIMIMAGLGLTLINALMVGFVSREIMRSVYDLRSDGVEALAGDVERVLRRGFQRDSYLLKIADQTLHVTKDVFLRFEHMRPYRIYRTRHTRIVLSAEPDADRLRK